MHAHSIFLDGLTRYGIFWLVGTTAVFVVAFVAAWRARGGSLGSRSLAMVTFIFLAGSTETIYSWSYVTVYLLGLIFTVGSSRLPINKNRKSMERRFLS